MEYLLSTFQPSFSQQSEGRTIKNVSPATLPGENTDATIGPSIFDLPVENLQKLQGARMKKPDRKNNNEQKNNRKQ